MSVNARYKYASTSGLLPAAIGDARNPNLDALRGIAILAVILFHINQVFVSQPRGSVAALYHGLAGFGWSGVDLFFVLSGFLITGILYDSADKQGYFRTFYIRRSLRIFPLYYAYLILFFLVAPLVLTAFGHATAVRDHIRPSTQRFAWLYLTNWVSGAVYVTYFPDYLVHFWSLSIEEQFYLVWPSVVKYLNRTRLKQACCLLILGSLVSRLVLYPAGWHGYAYTWTICRMDGLAIGALIALCMRVPLEWDLLKKWAPLAALVCAGVFAALAGFSFRSTMADVALGVVNNTVLAILFGGCLVLTLSPTGNWIQTVCSLRFLRQMGIYSYGAYVLHQPLLILLRRSGFKIDTLEPLLHSEGLAMFVVIAVSGVLTAAAAFGSWHLFEKHFLWLRGPLSRRLLRQSDRLGAAIPVIRRDSVEAGVVQTLFNSRD